MADHDYVVDGFVFHNRKDAEKAQKEYDGVKYLKERTAGEADPEKLLQIYNRLIDQKMFETPIGICYMKQLQNRIKEAPFIMDEAVTPLEGMPLDSVPPEGEDKNKTVPRDKKREKKELESAAGEVSWKFAISLFANVVMLVIVIGMFILASTINSPTILNYENKIIDKYEAWEQELSEREEAIEKAEKSLGIGD
ncbi:MAG: hypothetical protein K6G40_00155 [Eubacterium sp.]|nr:hypothetical protein [Eubacterium sp.]